MSASLRVSAEEWKRWEAECAERAAADKDRNAWKSAGPKGTDHLTERVADLEDALFLKQVMLESMADLIKAKAMELRIAQHRAARAEDVLQNVLDGMQPKAGLRAAA